jgi:hypothetical protein
MKMKLEKKMPISINDQVAHPNLMWPTPTNQEAGKGKFLETLTTKEGEPAKQGERAYNPKTGKHVQITLDRAAKMWPTPKARDYRGAEGKRVIETSTGYSKIRKESKVKYGASLNDVAEHLEMKRQKLWPTPTQDSATDRKKKYKQGGTPLTLAVRNWPTPTARDWKDSGKAVVNSPRHSLPQTVAKNDKEQWIKGGGALNPTWVEWLMGYPAEYTDLEDWAILSSRKSQKK